MESLLLRGQAAGKGQSMVRTSALQAFLEISGAREIIETIFHHLQHLLTAPEAERMISQLSVLPIEDVGSAKYLTQHDWIEKLNLQVWLKDNLAM